MFTYEYLMLLLLKEPWPPCELGPRFRNGLLPCVMRAPRFSSATDGASS